MGPHYRPHGPAFDILDSVRRLRVATVADLVADTGRTAPQVYESVIRLRRRGMLRRSTVRRHGAVRGSEPWRLTLTAAGRALLESR